MIAHDRSDTPVDLCTVETDGVSDLGWGDAVWHAIEPLMRRGWQVTHLDVLSHSKTNEGGREQYRVGVRLTYQP
jgi:hypothetical protein